MKMNPQQILKAAVKTRDNFTEEQKKRPQEFIPVAAFSERLVPTSAGETRILLSWPARKTQASCPVFVNLHGGGFILGRAEDDDEWCRKITNAAGCAVVNIDYHLAPEYKFPVALEECYDVIKWVHDNAAALNIDRERIAVGGHSAGGNLAAALCLLARERKEYSIVYQILDYPPLNLTLDPFQKKPIPENSFLPPKLMAFFNICYFRTAADAQNILVSPLLAENLENLPAALVITAEYDPLRDEGELYARRLAAAGVEVVYKQYAGCMHAFTHFGPQTAADDAWALIYAQLNKAFGS